jgi:hypothetical protein
MKELISPIDSDLLLTAGASWNKVGMLPAREGLPGAKKSLFTLS